MTIIEQVATARNTNLENLIHTLSRVIGGTHSHDTRNAVRVIIKNLWNCTLEEKMTPFFAQMIMGIMYPKASEGLPFEMLKEVISAMEDARNRDLEETRAKWEAKRAALRARLVTQ